jgi:hypothetical protein
MSHESDIREVFEERMAADPELGASVAKVLRDCRSGHITADFVDAVVQNWRGPLDLYDAFSIHEIIAYRAASHLVWGAVRLGTTPHPDHEVERNNRALRNLPNAFSARFWGEKADCDGFVEWHESFPMGIWRRDGASFREHPIMVRPGRLPLEVGYTKASRTISHLRSSYGGVARWPYGSDTIWFLLYKPDRLVYHECTRIEKKLYSEVHLQIA